MAVPLVAVALLAGSAISAYSKIQEGKAQAEALQTQALFKERQANELIRRSERNIDDLQRKARNFRSKQVGAYAHSGVSVDSGISLINLEQLHRDVAEEVGIRREETNYQAMAIRTGAKADIQLSEDVQESAKWSAFGTLLQGGAQAYGAGKK